VGKIILKRKWVINKKYFVFLARLRATNNDVALMALSKRVLAKITITLFSKLINGPQNRDFFG
jgi:hypothetical protein